MKIKVIMISAGRSDYDRYYPIINSLKKSKDFQLYLYLTKDHFSRKYGYTYKFVDKKLKYHKANSSTFSNYKLYEFTDDFVFLIKLVKKICPDLIIVMGDRFEMLLGPIVSIPLKIPIIHFYGGAVTEGSSDELVRHAITKMSHLHFVATENYKKRILQLGEENWRVKNIGVLSLKNIKKFSFSNKEKLSKNLNFNFNTTYAVLAYHPNTHELDKIENTLTLIKNAVDYNKLNLVITYPNSDLKNEVVIDFIKKNFKDNKKYKIIKNCGYKNFLNILKNSCFIIGNSSAGIVEAASLKVPSINIGNRQEGKIKPKNVINVNNNLNQILKAINKTKNKSFKKIIKKLKNPYESNFKADKVLKIIKSMAKRNDLLKKKFINIK